MRVYAVGWRNEEGQWRFLDLETGMWYIAGSDDDDPTFSLLAGRCLSSDGLRVRNYVRTHNNMGSKTGIVTREFELVAAPLCPTCHLAPVETRGVCQECYLKENP